MIAPQSELGFLIESARESEDGRLVLADWLDEHGSFVAAVVVREDWEQAELGFSQDGSKWPEIEQNRAWNVRFLRKRHDETQGSYRRSPYNTVFLEWLRQNGYPYMGEYFGRYWYLGGGLEKGVRIRELESNLRKWHESRISAWEEKTGKDWYEALATEEESTELPWIMDE